MMKSNETKDVPRGKFIVLDGLDGCGKTGVALNIQQWLEQLLELEVLYVREPGGTEVGEHIRSLFKDASIHRETMTELHLLMAARWELCSTVIEKALSEGKWVVADRYWFSTYAYQGFGSFLDKAKDITFISCGLPVPNIALWIDTSVEECLRRRVADATRVGTTMDAIEGRGDAFFVRARKGFQNLAGLDLVKRVNGNHNRKSVMEDVTFLINEII